MKNFLNRIDQMATQKWNVWLVNRQSTKTGIEKYRVYNRVARVN